MEGLKIIMIGPSGIGKTTLRKIFFEQESPIYLLKNSLEPTYGNEATTYDFGTKIIINDLAGQQINEWLTSSNDIFIEADLIIIINDCRESWEKSINLWKKVNQIKKDKCSNAIIGVLFHKIDLITFAEREELTKKIIFQFEIFKDSYAFLSSIAKDLYYETIKNFIKLFKKVFITQPHSSFKNLLIKMDILNQFIDKNLMSINEIAIQNNLSIVQTKQILADLQASGYLLMKDAMNIVELSQKGSSAITSLKENMYTHIQKSLTRGYDLVNGVAFSDMNGRPFFIFESIPDFFNTLVEEQGTHTDPTLITMFFSAIISFCQTISKTERLVFLIKNLKVYVYLVQYKNIFALFFMNDMYLSQNQFVLLEDFMSKVYRSLNQEINQFLENGTLVNIIQQEEIIIANLKVLDEFLFQIKQFREILSKEKIIESYNLIETKKYGDIDYDFLKKILIQFIIDEDVKMLKILKNKE